VRAARKFSPIWIGVLSAAVTARSPRGCRRRWAPRSRRGSRSSGRAAPFHTPRRSESPWLKIDHHAISHHPTASRTPRSFARSSATRSRPRRNFRPLEPPSSRNSIGLALPLPRGTSASGLAVVGRHQTDTASQQHSRAHTAASPKHPKPPCPTPANRDHRHALVANESVTCGPLRKIRVVGCGDPWDHLPRSWSYG